MFDVNDAELEAELKLLKSCPKFEIRITNKTIHHWLNKLSFGSLTDSFANIYKILIPCLSQFPPKVAVVREVISKLILVKTKRTSCVTQNRLESMILVFV